MRAAGFVGAVTDGEDLRLVPPQDIETLEPGIYSLDLDNSGEATRRRFTGKVWNAENGGWLYFLDHPQELVVRIMIGEVLPNNVPEPNEQSLDEGWAYNRREDRRGVVIMWVSEVRVPEVKECDFVSAPE